MEHPEQAYKYAGLILRHLKEGLNHHDLAVLENWLDSNSRNREFLESLKNDGALQEQLAFFASIDTEQAWSTLRTQKHNTALSGKIPVWKYAAAILLLLLSASIAFYQNSKPPVAPPLLAKKAPAYKHDIAPGGDKAKLTLADGSVILLDEADNGLISSKAGVKISKKGGQLVYQVLDAGADASISYNTISTPRGGQYQVLLPDGSRVWLNASSSLTFPAAFKGTERIVKLTGEAYFEIEKQKGKAGNVPFKVLANDVEVKVLGTHFNVMAYADEQEIKTTLLEGSVKVSKGSSSKLIVPGQQASIPNDAGAIDVSEADISETIAWKEGLFLFNNEDIQMVMRQVARWYDVDISYSGSLPEGHYTGKVGRNTNISKVLNLLELTGGAHFDIEDKKIKVYR